MAPSVTSLRPAGRPVTFAWFLLFMRKQKDSSTIETVLLGNALSALIGLPFLPAAAPNLADWMGMLFLGVFQIGLPSILIALAIKELTAVGAVLIQTLEPILNPVWVLLFIGEMPTPLALLGGAIVIGASNLPLCPGQSVAARGACLPAHSMTKQQRPQ